MLLAHARCLSAGWSGSQRSKPGTPTSTLSSDTRRWTEHEAFTRDISFSVPWDSCWSAGLYSLFPSQVFHVQQCPGAPFCCGMLGMSHHPGSQQEVLKAHLGKVPSSSEMAVGRATAMSI